MKSSTDVKRTCAEFSIVLDLFRKSLTLLFMPVTYRMFLISGVLSSQRCSLQHTVPLWRWFIFLTVYLLDRDQGTPSSPLFPSVISCHFPPHLFCWFRDWLNCAAHALQTKNAHYLENKKPNFDGCWTSAWFSTFKAVNLCHVSAFHTADD